MKTNLNEYIVAFQKGFMLVYERQGVNNMDLVFTLQANLMQYGYMLSEQAFRKLVTSTREELTLANNSIMDYIKDIAGGKVDYTPMYQNFPEEVMETSDSELFMNALMHYWSGGQWMPNSVAMARPVRMENIKYTMLEPITEFKLGNIFTNLVSINQSLTPQDMEVIQWFPNWKYELVFPPVIPFKENLCTLAAIGLKGLPVKNVTDVLRIAVHMSGGDISLPKVPPTMVRTCKWTKTMTKNVARDKFKFRKFTRAERRNLLSLLEQTNLAHGDLKPKKERWLRLGEVLHPGDYKNVFPKSYAAFSALRDTKIRSWAGQLNEALYKSFDLDKSLALLKQRPGEFVRKIDFLIRSFRGKESLDKIMKEFQSISADSSNKVMYELFGHFDKRVAASQGRSIMIKGGRKKFPLPELPGLGDELVNRVHGTILNTLKSKFSKLPALGKVWIDEELAKIPLPTNMRSMSTSLKPIIRGQRMPFDNPKAKVIRAYCHWTNLQGKTSDLDLSCTFVGSEQEILSFSTSGLKVGKSCHSGDITHRVGNNAEYIDVVVEDAISRGHKYAIIDVRNYSGRGLNSVQARFGMMEREHPSSNKTWLPETITNAQCLESEATNTLIAILDLEAREYVYLDLDSSGFVTATSDVKNILQAVKEYVEPPKFSVYTLLDLHAQARGTIVSTKEEADIAFTFQDFCNSYEKAAEYMGV